jgi:hypothetical protein
MELASLDGMEEQFDTYARELARAPLGVWVRSHYFLFLGEGFHRFGRQDAAMHAFEEAIRFAEANQVHHIAFKAQDALVAVRSGPRAVPAFAPPSTWVPGDVETVVRAISELRRNAVATP